jgi:hypothetical protein
MRDLTEILVGSQCLPDDLGVRFHLSDRLAVKTASGPFLKSKISSETWDLFLMRMIKRKFFSPRQAVNDKTELKIQATEALEHKLSRCLSHGKLETVVQLR